MSTLSFSLTPKLTIVLGSTAGSCYSGLLSVCSLTFQLLEKHHFPANLKMYAANRTLCTSENII